MAFHLTTCYSLIVTLLCLTAGSRVQLRNNYYTDLTVSLPYVSDNLKANVLSSLKELLEVFDKKLYKATKERAKLLTVNILVPASWGDSRTWLKDENATCLLSNGGHVSNTDVDVVFAPEEQQGASYTLNADSCGKRGQRIVMPIEFLLSNESSERKGDRFMRHWSQYRFGVFPENGFVNDSRYPQYYSTPGTMDIMITSCTNENLTYNFTDANNKVCEPTVDPETGKPAAGSADCLLKRDLNKRREPLKSSSLMDAHVNARTYCDSDISLDRSHNFNSPSKHNALCSEDGTWLVILRDEDFAKGRNAAFRYRFKKMQLRYIQESNLRIVVAVDVSSKMAEKGRYNLVKRTLSKFLLYDVPHGSEIGLIFFADEVKMTAPLTLISDEEAAENFLESGRVYDDPETTSESCTDCAVLQGIDMLRSDAKNGVIILVTSNSNLNNAEGTLEVELSKARIRLSVIEFASDDYFSQSKQLKSLAESSGGFVISITEFDETDTLFWLMMAFTNEISALSSSTKTSTSILATKELSGTSVSFHFNVDDSIDDMQFLVTGASFDIMDSPFEENSAQLTGPNGEIIPLRKKYNIPAWVFSKRNIGSGLYTFEARRKNGDSSRSFAMVIGKTMTDRPSLSLRAWISFQKEDGYPPMKLFAELRNGSHPVKNAEVTAIPFDVKGEQSSSRFLLVDDGLGDPDITRHDGIYSTYFVTYDSPGFYTVILKVIGKDETETVFVSPDECCGSYMPSYRTEPTGKFNRYTSVSFSILKRFSPGDAPPNRILDLQVSSLDLDDMTYNLTWSAAGADYNIGGAVRYSLKLFTDRNDAKRRFESTGIPMEYNREIMSYSSPSEYGAKQEYAIRLPETVDSGRYYFAVSAVDESSNAGRVSNVVEIVVSNKLKGSFVNCSYIDGEDNGHGGCSEQRADLLTLAVFLFLVQSFLRERD